MIDFTIIVRRTQGAFWIFLLGCLTACGGGEPSSDDTKLWPAPETAVFAPPEFLVSLAQTRLTQSAGPLQATPVVAMAHRTLTLGAAPSQATPAVALAMANQFFDLVELRFPDIFQSRSTTQTEGEWVFRAYFRVGIMVGVNTGQIYVYGGIFGPQLRLVGPLSNFVSEPSGTVLVSGLVSKGPLVGSTVCAYAITNSAKGVQLGACATTGSDGRYNVDLGSYAGAVLLEATSGIYVDEATGSTVSLSTPLRSMLTSVSGTTDSAAITPLTDLAYQMAMAAGGSLSASRMQSAIASVQSNFGVADIVRTMPANALNVAASSTSAEKIYALALATLSQYQKSRPAGTTINASLVYPMTETVPYIVQPKANLAPGASCTVSVVFTPSAGGARSGTLIIDSNASNGGNGLVPLTGNGGADALGTGTFSGVVLDAVTNGGIAGILINIYSGTTLVSSVTSDANGVFSSTVPVGTYKLVMSKSGYVTATINSASLQKDVTTTTETVLQVSSNNTGTGLVTGTVKDAFTGLGLSGVGLQFRAGINATSGTVVATATTGTGGAYSMATLTSGSYTVEASLSGYATGYFTVTVVGGITKANQAGTITPVLASGQTRVVLTWGATPSDLDSHLTGPTATGTRFHVYYSSKGSKVSSPNAALDVDDTSSYGPETTTIYQQSSGVYRFSVHNYSNSGSTSSTVLSASGAQVKVYLASGQSQTFQVPVGKVATLWTVFELNGNTLTPINTMTNANSSSSIQ